LFGIDLKHRHHGLRILAGEHGRDTDLLAMQAEAAAGGDDDIAIVERIDRAQAQRFPREHDAAN
jgi:hypothetical protein